MEDLIFHTTLTITVVDDIQFTINNIPISILNKFNEDSLSEIMEIQWYMFGVYDKVVMLGEEFTILAKTKKKVVLVKSN